MADSKYQRYLASRQWAVKREWVRRRAHGRCERCEMLPMVAVHYLTYEHIYDEPLEDLQAICEPCHLYASGKIPVDPIDVNRWAFSLGFSAFEADGPYPEGGRLSDMREYEDKYGSDWEFDFLALCLSWPTITNMVPMHERGDTW